MTRQKRWTMRVTVGVTGLLLLAAIVMRDHWLLLVGAIGAASAAVIWGPRAPLE